MRILFDHNTPAPLRHALAQHIVETAYERGWAELTNGKLLAAAQQAEFELLITTDQNIRYQQNLRERTISILVLSTNDWIRIRRVKNEIAAVVSSIQNLDFREFVVR